MNRSAPASPKVRVRDETHRVSAACANYGSATLTAVQEPQR